ncbi:MAG: hypothetical protein KC776_22115 [Myxococcales bacterium]|nr:hypothetical protein [Myxococcales bacterium]MCB9575667.1 hypothetical protein [Polyangiaceae bacterium]
MVKATTILGLIAALLVGGTSSAAPNRPHLVAGSVSMRGVLYDVGKDGSTWEMPGKAKVRLAAGSSIRMFRTPQYLQLSPGKPTRTYTMVLVTGTAYVDTAGSETAVLLTTTDKVSAIVRHGHAALAHRGAEHAVLNSDAEVLLSTGGGPYAAVAAGRRIGIDREGTLSDRPIPAAPVFQGGSRVWVANAGIANVSGVAWTATGKSYSVTLGEQQFLTKTATLPSTRLPTGRHELVVTPLDELGLPGTPSKPLAMYVVQAVVPEGSFVDARGVVRLGRGQAVSFEGSTGLNVSYGAEGRFFRAHGAIQLPENRPTTVYFHAPGSFELARTRVEPRGIEARISFTPKNAVWPDQALHVRVALRDREGAAAPAWIEPHVRVLVGVEPVELDVEKRDDGLWATVPPADTPGPWVVRVEVEDQYGIPLGRNFTEVARAVPRANERVARGR